MVVSPPAARRRIGAVLAIALVATGCSGPAPTGDPLPLLDAWPMSAQLGVDGTAITATYADWPLSIAPLVFACSIKPDQVFAPPPTHLLVIRANPDCVPMETALRDGMLRLRLDRLGLPASFSGLASWHVAFAVMGEQATWESLAVVPVVFPGVAPLPSPPAPGPN